ncbi:MAG: PDDEXK nuclease domain-containing protein [Nitrospirota bacterium]
MAKKTKSPILSNVINLPDNYAVFLDELKNRIRTTRVYVALSANRELVLLYGDIGKCILEQQTREGWGAKVIERLAYDLKKEFPEIKGFSSRNLKYMRAFAAAWPDREKVQQLAAQIPWFHNCIIIDKIATAEEREWYILQTIQNGWSRSILEMQIENDLYQRQGKSITNFERTLPPLQSDLAQQITKDPYVFDFLSLRDDYNERVLEQGLIEHVQRFLLELGAGFAFVGRQIHLEVGGEDFYIDLLFYHLKLRCFVVIDLKAREFIPEYAGKMNFYLSAVDDLLRHPEDKPSIGIILCKSKNRIITEYALRDIRKPVGVSGYITKMVESLPEKFKGVLPSPEEIEIELSKADWKVRSDEK